MTGVLINIAAFIVAISVLVAVHEYGHYLVGRLCGMKVLRFSIGFGKPLLTRVAGADRTEYCVSAIPLGGYVKFLDEREGPVAAEDQGRAFTHRPVPNRIAVLLAGPLFNFLFAILAYWVLFVNGVPTLRPSVGPVEENSYAATAGLEKGDRILTVGGRNATDWETTIVAIIDEMVGTGRVPLDVEGADGFKRKVTIDVGDDAARLTEPGILFEGLGFVPGQPQAIVGSLEEGGAAQAAGMRIGDRIVSIDGEVVESFADLQRVVSARPDQRVTIEVRRNDRTQQLDVELGSREANGQRFGFLGIGNNDWYTLKHGPLQAILASLDMTWAKTAFTASMFGRMIIGDVSIRNISGPISIAQFAGDSAARGLNYYLNFLALISISLGVINLLPIPLLDGGQIVYQSIEWIKGSPLSEKSQIIGQQVGIFALLLLMSFAFYNDFARIFG
ncbi:MAG: RIP metalloprotease RseP [Gammaproteobacteria bacterium]|nr:RIP metalloprotease RseP [Gammaproteobacteria bacterium]MDH4313567.1 RIP metalloprotease RseP [Gammaproteobacteria bacterium]MDH5212636.1 RIP metalloprotease RseP [Gammaproteobacteria bacterium]